MNAEYKRDLQNNYLILEAPEAEEDDYRLRMAEQNEISGLLPFHSARKNGILYLHYEITSRQTLESVYEKRKMGYEDIFFLLAGIRDVLEAMQRFLLDPMQLVFDPEYLYLDPDRHRVQVCYLPGSAGSYPIAILAEFILKKLDHREQQAVTLGYGFYQKAMEENFSLQKTLKEILEAEETQRDNTQEQEIYTDNAASYRAIIDEKDSTAEKQRVYRRDNAESTERGGTGQRQNFRKDYARDELEGVPSEIRESYGVTHKERKRQPRGIADKLFQIVHPAVLLSTLILLVLLEVVYYFGMLTVTETGGIFFLLISVEALANKFWKASKEKKKGNRWVTEEEDELYQMLQEEMYATPEETSIIEETRCLVPEQEPAGICLICTHGGSNGMVGQDIFVGSSPVYVGKVKGESDVILDSPTVSRRHARLECREGVYYVKDLNSRNGTFCNGRRLRPQEQCQFVQGDEISFAEIGYRAVLR